VYIKEDLFIILREVIRNNSNRTLLMMVWKFIHGNYLHGTGFTLPIYICESLCLIEFSIEKIFRVICPGYDLQMLCDAIHLDILWCWIITTDALERYLCVIPYYLLDIKFGRYRIFWDWYRSKGGCAVEIVSMQLL